jgi:arylsulfatase A-like enzyme
MKSQRRTVAALAVALLGVIAGNARAGQPKPPNVLFVLSDAYRYSALDFVPNRDEGIRTPNFRKLAETGVTFTRCYAAQPRCTPNRASIITGRFPSQTGMIDNSMLLPRSERCIAQVFTEAGYACHYIGKWHMDGKVKPGFILPGWRRRGFTTFEGFNSGHRHTDSKTFDNEGKLLKASNIYEPTLQADLAMEFMKKNKDRPFFCFVSWGPPHTPRTKLEKFGYSANEIKVRPNAVGTAEKGFLDYFSNCSALDHEFGRLTAFLKESGLEENTLVVFTSDHGAMGGSHGKGAKNHPEEESSRVPLLMRLPGRLKAGQQVPALFSSVDLMPTILSICNLPVPDTCTGKDKSAAAMPGGSYTDESIYIQEFIKYEWRCVVKGDYKLVVTAEAVANAPEYTALFNLKKDPYELDNLLDIPKFKAIQEDMIREYGRWRRNIADPFPEYPEERASYGLERNGKPRKQG